MGYRFTRRWGQASVLLGVGVFLIALLLPSWLALSNGNEVEQFSSAVRIMAFLVVSLVGLLVGGTMVVAGQLICVLLDQRELLARIHETLTKGGPAEITDR